MRQDPYGRSQYGQGGGRRGGGLGNLRWLILLGFLVYGGCYYLNNRVVDPYTGEKVLIDNSIGVEEEKALGLQAYEEILQQERPVDPNSQIAQQVRTIAQRLIARIPEVEAAIAAEKGTQPSGNWKSFEWDVNVIESEQANAFCLPGGKMAVYTGLIPVAQNADAVAVVMGHEIAHALMRHGAQRMARGKLEQIGQMAGAASGMDAGTLQTVMSAYGVTSALPYARGHESQADEVGLMLSAAVGVQRDHVGMINNAMRSLAEGGTLIFSNNLRSFKLDTEALSGFTIKDISAQTIDEDFKRNPKIHQCWLITH